VALFCSWSCTEGLIMLQHKLPVPPNQHYWLLSPSICQCLAFLLLAAVQEAGNKQLRLSCNAE
jgi:hypothetical protein